MPKTLKDCLLEGGVKGKTFRDNSLARNKYTVRDIFCYPNHKMTLYVESKKHVGRISPHFPPDHYYLDLGNHYKDILVEKQKPKSTLPIPLPAP